MFRKALTENDSIMFESAINVDFSKLECFILI